MSRATSEATGIRIATATGTRKREPSPSAHNDEFLRVLENFPAATHDDEVDGLSGAYELFRTRANQFAAETVEIARPYNNVLGA